jgi:D-lactate dehydrogenase (cytochrome)
MSSRQYVEQQRKIDTHRIKTRLPIPANPHMFSVVTDLSERKTKHIDAAHVQGHIPERIYKLFPTAGKNEVAEILKNSDTVVVIGAQSSLTGGATAPTEHTTFLDTTSQKEIIKFTGNTVTIQTGITLHELNDFLAKQDQPVWYPPVPTFDGATVGGVIANNAAGANTFKYGSTRNWVEGLTVVLANGEIVELERGEHIAHPPDATHTTSFFELEHPNGSLTTIPVPTYTMPDVPKLSAGYFAKPDMDLIDLFIGSEGTLGVITEAKLRVIPKPFTTWAIIPCENQEQALAVTKRLRDTSIQTWETHNAQGIDISAIEYIDNHSLQLVREAGKNVPKGANEILIVQMEMTPEQTDRQTEDLMRSFDTDAPDVPIVHFANILSEYGLLEHDQLGIATPKDAGRIEQFTALREAVPEVVNKINGERNVQKIAGDFIVPFDRLGKLLDNMSQIFSYQNFEYAIWGHISDGNMHPNILVHSEQEARVAKAIIQNIGKKEVIHMAGSPLAEHGVGRSPVKQSFLIDLYGEEGVEQMREVKEALDPKYKLAPGNIFPQPEVTS